MDLDHIAELLQPFLIDDDSAGDSAFLSPPQLLHISTYIDLLLRWNARINLTSIRHPEPIVTRHFGESLFAARCLFPEARVGPGLRPGQAERRSAMMNADVGAGVFARANDSTVGAPFKPSFGLSGDVPNRLTDLGSGAGFPGIPIKLWAPDLRVTLIESNHKKATFLREVARTLTLTGINVLSIRAEELLARDPTPRAAVVTLRAVERFEQALPTAGSLVVPGGRLALLIGSAQVSRARELAPSFTWDERISIPLSTSRVLLLGTRDSSVERI